MSQLGQKRRIPRRNTNRRFQLTPVTSPPGPACDKSPETGFAR
jgi:hypothetical protein